MGWKDKADVMQGIAGVYILLIMTLELLGLYFVPTMSGDILIWGIIPIVLGIVCVGLKENEGIDLFGVILTVLSMLTIFCYLYFTLTSGGTITIPLIIVFTLFIGRLTVSIGLLLEAFDIIKPLKVK